MASKRVNRLNAQFHIKNPLYRALLAEFMATLLLMVSILYTEVLTIRVYKS
jgi:hypothetical protein